MSIQKVIDAIREIDYHRNFKIDGTNIDDCNIEWINGNAPISKDDIRAKMDERQAQYDSQEYARKRKAEYPSIEELVVALYDSEDRAAVDEKRATVKLKYPKP